MKKIFYDPSLSKWKYFEAPEKPNSYHFPTSGWGTHEENVAWEAYEKAYALAKENALEVGNVELIQTNFHGVVFIPTGIGEIKSAKPYDKGEEIDWPGTAVIRDNKYYLSV